MSQQSERASAERSAERAADLHDQRAKFLQRPAEALMQGGLAARNMYRLHEHIEPTETERDTTTLVLAAALALPQESLAAVGAPHDLNPLEAALLLVASGDHVADALYGALADASEEWRGLLAPLESLTYVERTAVMLMPHYVIARTIEARDRRFRRFAGRPETI